MPELPEVETTRRALEHRLAGLRIVRLVQRIDALRFPLPRDLARRLEGRTVQGFRRRAKYIIADLDDGSSLVLHLGMSGRLVLGGADGARHEHLTFFFEDESRLGFVDPRRFGMLDLVATQALEAHRLLRHLGLEPLGNAFSGEALGERLQGRATALKVALMDQRLVVGIGNIYASESLNLARLSPRRRAGGLGPRRLERLAGAVRTVLLAAIDAGGSSLRDYVQADGALGNFQNEFRVYDREGARCPCGRGIVRRFVQGGRATFHCPACQR